MTEAFRRWCGKRSEPNTRAIIIINDFFFHASKNYIGYSRRGYTNEVYVQRGKKIQKYKIV